MLQCYNVTMLQCYNAIIRLNSSKQYFKLVAMLIALFITSCQQSAIETPTTRGQSEAKQVGINTSQTSLPIQDLSKWSNDDWNTYFMMNLMDEMSTNNNCYSLTSPDGLFEASQADCNNVPPTLESKICRLSTGASILKGDFGKIKTFISCAKDIIDSCGSAHLYKKNDEYIVEGC